MKNRSILLIILFLLSTLLVATIPMIDDLTGSWAFSVEQTMPEYSKGKIVFEEAENDEYSGKIVFETGRVISLSSVEIEADTVTFKAYVDGGLVTTVCTLAGDELNGSVQTPDGSLPFKAVREE